LVALHACSLSLALDEPSKPDIEDWFGIDVEVPSPDDSGEKRSVRLKANPGNNLTALAMQFFTQHSPNYKKADMDFVVEHLENAAGGRCDACKTFVEVMTETFITMGTKFAKTEGVDQFGKPQKSMHVDSEMESYLASMCRGDLYNDYAPHIRKGCEKILSSPNSRQIFSIFNNGTLGPANVVARKTSVCSGLMKMCDEKPTPTRTSLTKCRSCAEVMEDLHLSLRRSNRQLTFGGDKLRKKMTKNQDGYLSRRHVASALEDLCSQLELRHPPSIKDELEEVCETLVSEYSDDILNSFMAQNGGHQHTMPGGYVCVTASEMCTRNNYALAWPLLESYHYNFSYYRKLPERAPLAPSEDSGSTSASVENTDTAPENEGIGPAADEKPLKHDHEEEEDRIAKSDAAVKLEL